MKECNNCGKCCNGSSCGLATKHGHGYIEKNNKPCPAIKKIKGKYFCNLVLKAKGKELNNLIYYLKIGEGCHLWA